MLRKLLFFALIAAWGLCAPAHAQLIVSDGFDYAPGAITGDNGGTGWANAWTSSSSTNPNQVTSGGLTFSQNGATLAVSGDKLTTVGGDVGAYRRPPTAFGQYGGNVNQELWFSFLAQNTGGTTGYGGLSLFVPGSTEQFFVGQLSGQGVYGFQNNSLTAIQNAEDSPQATTIQADGTTHFLVLHLSFTGDGNQSNGVEATFFTDPTPGVTDGNGSPTGFTNSVDTVYTDSFQFGKLRFQSGGDTTNNFDEIRMGSSFLDVAPQAIAPTPEPGAPVVWLSGFGVLGFAALRRRHRAA